MKIDLNQKYAIDTNILIYSLDNLSNMFEEVKDLLQISNGNLYITHQNVLEALSVLTKTYDIDFKQSLDAINNLIYEFEIAVISPLPTTLNTFTGLMKKQINKIDIFDYYLASTLIDNEITNLITYNYKDFKNIKKIKTYIPKDLLNS